MPEIGSMARMYDGHFDGRFVSPNFNTRFAMVPCRKEEPSSGPDYRLYAPDFTEIGTAWTKFDKARKPYFVLKLNLPLFAIPRGIIRTEADQDDPAVLKITWTAPAQSRRKDVSAS